jgi:small ligand-binding sensory domain FIST
VLAFNNNRSTLSEALSEHVPKDAIILGAISGDIQVNHNNQVEHKSDASVMIGSFPNAVIKPFCVEYDQDMEENIDSLQNDFVSSGVGWKALIIYACGSGAELVDTFITKMQAAFPEVALVGGICEGGYVSRVIHTRVELSKMSIRALRKLNRRNGGQPVQVVEKYELVEHIFNNQGGLEHVEDAVFGVALGGDAPVRSMVSRGVRSITHGVPQSSSPLVVQDVLFSRPGDDSYMFQGSNLQSMHMIRHIRNTETDKVMTAVDMMRSIPSSPEFIGIKRPKTDGFELHMISPYSQAVEAYLIMTDGTPEQEESLVDAEIDFFNLSGEACLEDMDTTVAKLREQTQGEQILGAVMFSCSGRGPDRGRLIQETMADATRFAKVFPEVPCLGFYAGGEIGPMALAGNQNVFQTGRAAVQGFTAVFALFIVPVVKNLNYHLDDCSENVDRYVESCLAQNGVLAD